MSEPTIDTGDDPGFERVAIVGLGLMGGSLAAALRGRCRTVIGVARRPATVEEALARGFVDEATCDLALGVRDADVVILATPVRVILRLLSEIGPLLAPGCLLMDIGSTKTQIVAAMADLPPHVEPLGGHPMCGKERAGLAAAEATLYRGATFVLTPLPRTSHPALARGKSVVRSVGARPLLLDAARHDRLVATISHMPYLVACALVATAMGEGAEDPSLWQLAAGGFRDTSRLAASDPTMMLDILLTNHKAVLRSVESFQANLANLAAMLRQMDEGNLRRTLEAYAERRRELWMTR